MPPGKVHSEEGLAESSQEAGENREGLALAEALHKSMTSGPISGAKRHILHRQPNTPSSGNRFATCSVHNAPPFSKISCQLSSALHGPTLHESALSQKRKTVESNC